MPSILICLQLTNVRCMYKHAIPVSYKCLKFSLKIVSSDHDPGRYACISSYQSCFFVDSDNK